MSTITAKKKVFNNVLEAIGDTPMIRINRITKGLVKATVLAKIETVNPGNSIKDRMAVRMIEDAERKGLLKPGGTIIEGTSGNTGMGLAIAAVVKGYRCVFTTTDKQSKEKIDALRGFGAEVIVCLTTLTRRTRGPTIPCRHGSSRRFRTPGRPTRTTTCRIPRRTTKTPVPRSGTDGRPHHASRRRGRHRRHD